MNEEELKKAIDKIDFMDKRDKKDLLKSIFEEKNFGLAAEQIGEGDGDKNLIKDLLCKEEERIANFTVKDFNVERGDDEEDSLPDDMLKREKENKHYQLALKIKKYLKDYDWAEKIADETLKRAKNLKHPSDFLFEAIILTTAYDKENESKIIEFLTSIESNGIIDASTDYDDEYGLYSKLYNMNTKSNDYEARTAEYYDKEKTESYLKKMENLANDKNDFNDLADRYFEYGNKEKAQEMINKLKEKINLNDVDDAILIVSACLNNKMKEEATALFNESSQKLNEEDTKRLREFTGIT